MADSLKVPSNDDIALLEPFALLGLAQIVVVETAEAAQRAVDELLTHQVVGFDTESKPTFTRDQVSEGPHLIQFATADKAYLFQLHLPFNVEATVQLLEATTLTKVGFGLAGDRTLIAQKLGAQMAHIIDLNNLFREAGFRKSMGVKAAVAVVFGKRFPKSKRVSTSNWAERRLSPAQIVYAANDAYAAYRVFASFNMAALKRGATVAG